MERRAGGAPAVAARMDWRLANMGKELGARTGVRETDSFKAHIGRASVKKA
jgi:hypothetical protein